MSNDEIQRILEQLHARTPSYVVRIDLEMLGPNDRMAYVYVDGRQTHAGVVGRADVARLIAAGASWSGTPVRESAPQLRV